MSKLSTGQKTSLSMFLSPSLLPRTTNVTAKLPTHRLSNCQNRISHKHVTCHSLNKFQKRRKKNETNATRSEWASASKWEVRINFWIKLKNTFTTHTHTKRLPFFFYTYWMLLWPFSFSSSQKFVWWLSQFIWCWCWCFSSLKFLLFFVPMTFGSPSSFAFTYHLNWM